MPKKDLAIGAALALFVLGAFWWFHLSRQSWTPPNPPHWCTDYSGLMTEAARNDLDTRLHDYEKQTKHQVWVYIIATSKPDLTSEWCKRAFNAWGVGREGLDDGLVLFVFSRDHVTRVELGYGFEAAISDQEATRVATKIEARIRKGQPDEAISQGIQELIADIDKWEMKQ